MLLGYNVTVSIYLDADNRDFRGGFAWVLA